jgi:hypothetical protein
VKFTAQGQTGGTRFLGIAHQRRTTRSDRQRAHDQGVNSRPQIVRRQRANAVVNALARRTYDLLEAAFVHLPVDIAIVVAL